jgi:hypothetical protein
MEIGLDTLEFVFRGIELRAEIGDRGAQRRDVLAMRLRLADRLRATVALVLQRLGTHLHRLARVLPRVSAFSCS